MEVLLRAYDHAQLIRAESLPVERLWSVLDGAGMRNRALEVEPLTGPADEWARETVLARLEALLQEGFARDSLEMLRDPQARRRSTWPPIEAEEAVALREDLIRYLTYGLLSLPAREFADSLASYDAQWNAKGGGDKSADSSTAGFHDLISELMRILPQSWSEDKPRLRVAEHGGGEALAGEHSPRVVPSFGPAIRSASSVEHGHAPAGALGDSLKAARALLEPATDFVRAAAAAALRVIAYENSTANDGLRNYIAADMAARLR